MKNLLFSIAIAAISISVKAQTDSTSMSTQYNTDNKMSGTSAYKKSSWNIAINPSLPIGHFNSYSSFGLGAYLGMECRTSKSLGLTLNAGYIDYFGKTTGSIKYSDFKYVPVLAGAKFYLGDGGFYIHPEAGAGFGASGLGTSFWYGAGLGDKLGKAIDMELKYVGWHQNFVNSIYGGTGGTGGTGGGGYGGHYSTIDLKIGFIL